MISAHSTPAQTAVVWRHASPSPPAPSLVAKAGFVVFCVYLLSGFANDWSLHVFGFKAYFSAVSLALLPPAWLFSGNALRGFHTRTGRYWAAFLFWMLLAAPFSVWKGGSATMLANYIPRAYLCFFYTCSFATSLRRCRQLMYVQIAAAAALLLSCAALGGTGDNPAETRFRIPHSLFYANSNDLALALLLGICAFLFLAAQRSFGPRLAGAAGIFLSGYYAFQTGSRGSVVAAASMFALIYWLSHSKWKLLALGLAAAAALFAASIAGAPSSTLHRLSLLLNRPTDSSADISSVASQEQREEVFKSSLRYTLAHPLLGVGPDQFPTAVEQDSDRAGQHAAWLGTHNTYTQVSSECGIPAFIFFGAVIVLCLRSNFRLYLGTRDRPALRDVAALSRCLLAGTCVYAVSAFFFHMAYSVDLPLLAGFTVALRLASDEAAKSMASTT